MSFLDQNLSTALSHAAEGYARLASANAERISLENQQTKDSIDRAAEARGQQQRSDR